jgi:hypothetical protein
MKIIIAIVLALSISTGSWATLITVDSVEYNIEWEIGTFGDVNAAHDLVGQEWWGSETTAGVFATAIGIQSGLGSWYAENGPMFAYAPDAPPWLAPGEYFTFTSRYTDDLYGSGTAGVESPPSVYYTSSVAWAYASPAVPAPAPATLALLALGMIGVASRRFKKQAILHG